MRYVQGLCVLAVALAFAVSVRAEDVVEAPARVFHPAAAPAVEVIPANLRPLADALRPATAPRVVSEAAFAHGLELALTGLDAKGGKRTLGGIHVDAPAATAHDWSRVDRSDTVSWFLALRSPGATMIRPHFTRMPEGRLWVRGAQGDAVAAKPTRTATTEDFWGPIVMGDTVTIEFVGRAAPPANLVDMLSHGLVGDGAATESWCYLDPTCYTDGNAVKKGVGWMWLDDPWGSFICTGSLLSDAAGTFKPYFLTANHCLNSDNEADALAVVFGYHTSTCNGSYPEVDTLEATWGADYLVGNSTSDFSLLLMDEDPPAGSTYLGWSTNALAGGEDITVVHHPDGAFKRITFGDEVGDDTNFWEVRYTESSTEGGSSGSPLFNNNMQVVGQLYGGTASCNHMSWTDEFGKFSRSWNFGLSTYLNATTTSSTTTTTTTTHPPTTTTTPPTTTTTTIPADDDSDDDSSDDDADDDDDDDDWHDGDDDDDDDSDNDDDNWGDDDADDDDDAGGDDDDDDDSGCGC